MNDTQLGTIFRAIRVHRRLRQQDVAARARVSQSSVSRIERGHFGSMPVRILRSVAAVLEIRLEFDASWRGGSHDRIVSARHTALHEALAERLDDEPGWVSAAEVSFSIWGERGVIDRLAFHAGRQMLAVLEIKSDLSDPAGLIGQVDRYRRLAPEIAKGQGWDADHASCWVVVADTDTNRRGLAANRELLRGAFPEDGRGMRRWFRDPETRVDGLAFVAYPRHGTGNHNLAAVKRVRVLRPVRV